MHGAAYREDTTIARHMVAVGSLAGREWTYRAPEDVADLLLTRATRDPKTDRPLLSASTDTHALRTYVDDTWDAEWKTAIGRRDHLVTNIGCVAALRRVHTLGRRR